MKAQLKLVLVCGFHGTEMKVTSRTINTDTDEVTASLKCEECEKERKANA